MRLQRAIFMLGSAAVAAAFVASLIKGDMRRAVIYAAACIWWAFAWLWGERYNR